MEKLYWDTIKINDKKLYFTVNSNGLNFISDADQGISQIYQFYPKGQFEFRNQRKVTAEYVDQFEDFLLGEIKQFDLPIDIQEAGDAKLQRVWQLIQTIPYGSIMSVAELAQKAGVDEATVKHALKESPLMMIIPVHRIICEEKLDNVVRGGLAMKSQLLEMEAINGLDDIE
ncbi:methylated-DNA--[protein]-cysteine S-methyltransferase [Nicoliella lavandulae]|uniref:Methylated-DNA--[protein]-cysteine S-methyltransferase n=1 Tax=Nicoliella lavandulae TaxID=3082954 RepID=A0ABU8SJ76_9LACO